jgi:hypothetical protein
MWKLTVHSDWRRREYRCTTNASNRSYLKAN